MQVLRSLSLATQAAMAPAHCPSCPSDSQPVCWLQLLSPALSAALSAQQDQSSSMPARTSDHNLSSGLSWCTQQPPVPVAYQACSRPLGPLAFIPSVAEPAAASSTSPILSSGRDLNSSRDPATSSTTSSTSSQGTVDASTSSGSGHKSSSSGHASSSSRPHEHGQQRSLQEVLHNAGVRALGGGLPGAAAMVVQVLSLMWLRTTVNYQYRYGTSTSVALRTLYADGGVARFYQGVGPALLQGPLCRFGDTAANAGMLSVLAEYEATRNLPLGVQTAAASGAAACWRMVLLPLDAVKTMMQVEGKHGFAHLLHKVRMGGPGVLYHGAAASLTASFVGHYPWFTMYNTLNSLIPVPESLHNRLLRSAGIGFCAGVVSDAVSNSVRVVKTGRQTARHGTSYREVIKSIVAKDGVSGLFTRGLTTRIAANGLQNICFTVLWNLGQERMKKSKLLTSG